MADKLEILITADDRASGVLGGLRGALAGLGSLAMGALAAGAAVATGALVGLGAALKDATLSAMESEEAVTQLNAVLQSTGGVAGITSEQAQELAGSLQLVTKFSDEAILGGESLLLTFTNIGQNIFPDATKVMLDMSQALGQDLKSSAIQLGKALQDPILGITALRRVGVNFSEADQEMIKGLVESGQLMQAQTFILKELQKEFGGSAEAAGKTFGGQLAILNNRFDEIKESLGRQVIPILQMLLDRIVIPMIPYVEKAAKAFGEFLLTVTSRPEFQQFITGLATGIEGFLTTLTKLGNLQLPELQNLPFQIIGQISQSMQAAGGGENLFGALTSAIGDWFVGLTAKIRDWAANIDWKAISDSIAAFIAGIDWNKLGLDLRNGLSNLGKAINDFFRGIDWLGLFKTVGDAILSFMTGFFFGASWQQIKDTWSSNFAQMGEIVDKLKAILQQKFNDIKNAILSAIGVSGQLRSELDRLMQTLGSMVLPGWLMPGSPTPFELGLRGIHDAMQQINATPLDIAGGLQPAGAGARMPAVSGGNTFQFSFPNYLGSRQELETALRETVRRMQADGSI